MKMGDPVRAVALLEQSRVVFEGLPQTDPVAVRELAETDHLIARVPLHVAARPGREDDALASALDHALAARKAYARLSDVFACARVLETTGRLELKRGRIDKAVASFEAALIEQQRISDLVGLARTTAGLSEALRAADRPKEALELLSDSIALNHQKGSVIGIAFNRRAFDVLAPALSEPAVLAATLEVRSRLEAAEAELGAIHLAGETD